MSINIRPGDMPELRAELVEQLRRPAVMRRMWPEGVQPDEAGKRLEADLIRLTATATLFHVSEEMAALAAEASESLEKFALQAEDVPCRDGLIVFDGEAPLEAPYDDGCKNELRGIAWYSDGGSVLAMPVVLPHGDLGKGGRVALDPGGCFLARYGAKVEELLTPAGGPAFDVFGMLLTVWLLMMQPLVQMTTVEPDRAARKRLRRLAAEAAPVRVVELRRRKADGAPGDGSREFHHQWIVRGHWRQQWHPKREVHRPVWIAPHVKGPEGAPLIGGEKVYAWKR